MYNQCIDSELCVLSTAYFSCQKYRSTLERRLLGLLGGVSRESDKVI